ncbi:Protein neprosin [Cardamine amara subsp. amara]|uniref:Protein neprosin n=1 Tax=Cardamine amara subsp. amara TaxID=228776 RepID=A0ABD1A261_CARAN
MEVIVLASNRSLLLFLVIVSLSLSHKVTHISAFNYTKPYRQVSSLRHERIQKHLNKINKPPVFTIQSPDGDLIDCVYKRKQPALDHPLLKHHKIQKAPKRTPKMMEKERNDDVKEAAANVSEGAWQLWHVNGTRCPKGTVPIRRNTMNDVLRAKSLFDFGKKRRNIDLDRRTEKPDALGTNGHEHAIAYTETSSEIYGAKATMNVWDPKIEEVNEFSLSQIWILSGSFVGPDLNSIEAGWQVSPELYGDNRPRLFTYWTSDSYQATGCYNLLCSGFIQTNNKIAIGAAISPLSTFKGNQFDITILIWKDPKMGNWWMGLGDNTLVGYWPAELFTHLADHATTVEWGGEVVNTRASGRHTTTQMGSGHFPDEGFGKASYFRNLEVVDSDNSLVPVRDVKILAENTECYDIKSSYSNEWGTYFYYGGPGFNPRCN